MSKYIVSTNMGETSLYTDSVTYESVKALPRTDEDEAVTVVFAVFTPRNGYQAGKVHRVPLIQVYAIVEDN